MIISENNLKTLQTSYRPTIFTKISKYCFNSSNGTEIIAVSTLFRRLFTVFSPSRDWQYSNSQKHSKSRYSVFNRGPRGKANAQRYLKLVGQVPLYSCAVEKCVAGKLPCNALTIV